MRIWLKAWTAAVVLSLMGGCASQIQQPTRGPEPSRPAWPVTSPSTPSTPSTPAPQTQQPDRQASHPRFAPPPGVSAQWDNRLAVYVLTQQAIYYRERVFYRFDKGWFSAFRLNGPWEPAALPQVPRGLHGLYR